MIKDDVLHMSHMFIYIFFPNSLFLSVHAYSSHSHSLIINDGGRWLPFAEPGYSGDFFLLKGHSSFPLLLSDCSEDSLVRVISLILYSGVITLQHKIL